MAPEYWRELDPSWRGEGAPPMRRYFHPDGSITADPEDKVWGGHEASYTIVTSLLADGQVREHYVRINRWPKMMVKRHPDWSWELRNHLYFYRSIPERHSPASTSTFTEASQKGTALPPPPSPSPVALYDVWIVECGISYLWKKSCFTEEWWNWRWGLLIWKVNNINSLPFQFSACLILLYFICDGGGLETKPQTASTARRLLLRYLPTMS